MGLLVSFMLFIGLGFSYAEEEQITGEETGDVSTEEQLQEIPESSGESDFTDGSPSSESEFEQYVSTSSFAHMGEAENLARGMSQIHIRQILEKKLKQNPTDAYDFCVIAELMRRVNHPQTEEYYQRAIAARPKEPAFNFWYGQYLRIYRGLNYAAEKQYYVALRKLRERKAAGYAVRDDPFLKTWIDRGLVNNYQDYGFPILQNKAFPYKNADGDSKPGLFYLANINTGILPVDFGQSNYSMNFSTLKTFFNQSSLEADKDTINDVTVKGICRSTPRFNTYHRFRFYLPEPKIPAVDLHIGHNTSKRSQFYSRFEPDSFVNTATTRMGFGIHRSYNFFPLIDLKFETNYNFLRRYGMVEFHPDTAENIHMFDSRIDISRFISSDKLIVSLFATYLNIPEPKNADKVEKRSKLIKGFMIDYAFYRALPLPIFEFGKFRWRLYNTRGVHLFGGMYIDEEVWHQNLRVDKFVVLGTHLKGMWRFDFSFYPMFFLGETMDNGLNEESNVDVLKIENKFIRPNFMTRFRIIDEEVTPWLPEKGWYFRPASLELAIPIRWDAALNDMDKTYENFGIGIELWSKVVSKALKGTTTLFTLAYEYQKYPQLGKSLINFHFDIRMGWGRI